MSILSFQIEDALAEKLNTLPNKSEYVRDLLRKNFGQREKGLQELYIERDEEEEKVKTIQEQITKLEMKLLEQKSLESESILTEQAKQKEKNALKEKLHTDIYNNLKPTLSGVDIIKNFEYPDGWDSAMQLQSLMNKLAEQNITVSTFGLKIFLEKQRDEYADEALKPPV
jgi:hypothetical protein